MYHDIASSDDFPPPTSVYVHVPFCRRRCGYCNFTLVAGRDELVEAYLDALALEVGRLAKPLTLTTLYFGGGTPSHLSPSQAERLLRIIQDRVTLQPGAEVTLEANPRDVDAARLAAWTDHGVNRLSLGVQSFCDRKLAVLERDHRRADAIQAIELARRQIPRLAIDLIFAAPGETLDEWRNDLQTAISLDVPHLSTYGLTYERGALFWSRLRRGQLVRADEDAESALYEMTMDRLATAGFEHYEVSNFAHPGGRSRHNEVYWTGASYEAFGPGAARFVSGRREINHRSTTTYIRRLRQGESPVAESERLSPENQARELFVFGMRRLEGVEEAEFVRRTGFGFDDLFAAELEQAHRWGLLERAGARVRLTRRGLLVSDSIWPDFLRE